MPESSVTVESLKATLREIREIARTGSTNPSAFFQIYDLAGDALQSTVASGIVDEAIRMARLRAAAVREEAR